MCTKCSQFECPACSATASYGALVGMAVQSGRFQSSMQHHVEEMTRLSSEAVFLQTSAVADASEAAAESAQAPADESESQSLKSRAAVLEGEAEALEVSAANQEEGSKALNLKAREEQIAAETDAVRAAADEEVADAEGAVAEEAAVAASRYEAEEVSDGSAVVVCEFLPLLDVVCDVVGGIAEVSLATAAVAEVAEAVAATSAAAAAREDERLAVANAAEAEALATSDEEAAVVLNTKAKLAEEDALSDHQEAERDEAESIALHIEAEEQEALANEMQMNAEEEEASADASLEKAAQHGLSAAQQAILSSAAGLCALSYFGIKCVTRVLGGLASFVATIASETIGKSNESWYSSCCPPNRLRDLSYSIVHVLVFLSTTGSAMSHLEAFHILDGSGAYDTRSQGGLLLIFGLIGATAHCSVLHVLPDVIRRHYPICDWVALYVFMLVLFILEALILLVTLRGTSIGSSALSVIHQLPLFLLWVFLGVCSVLHFCAFRVVDQISEPFDKNDEIVDCERERTIDERASLLESHPNHFSRRMAKRTSTPRYSWKDLLIPLEGLLLSCMVPIFLSCFSHAKVLWPLLRHWIIGFEWVIPVVAVVYLLLVGVIVWSSARRR